MSLKYEPASEPLHIYGGGKIYPHEIWRAECPEYALSCASPLSTAGRGTYRGTSLIRNSPLSTAGRGT